ncbi:MAG: glycosyltransferase family 4 protein [Bacteroidota bacterium]
MKVYFLTKYHREGPSSRYRSFNYIRYFENAGLNPEYRPLFYEGYVSDIYQSKRSVKKIIFSYLKRMWFLLQPVNKSSFFIIEKELFPGVPGFIEKLLLFNKKYSIDYDDAVFTRYEKNLFLKNKHLSIGKKARLITVGNHWYFSQFPPDKTNCVYLPTVIDQHKYPEKKYAENPVPVICWIGTPSNMNYVQQIIPVFKHLQKKGIDFIIRVIGAEIVHPDIKIENLKWNEDKEYEYLASSDIGIMPLNNTKWEKGKCGFKIIQYMISGIPVIASPSPANLEIINKKELGYIASNDNTWMKSLEKLLRDAELRKKIGNEGRSYIKKNYSYHVWGPKYAALIKKESNK